jgi:hypothetical protein
VHYLVNILPKWRRTMMLVSVGLALLLNQGCSRYATTGESLYKGSRNGPLLVVPLPLTADNISSFYVLPNPSS